MSRLVFTASLLCLVSACSSTPAPESPRPKAAPAAEEPAEAAKPKRAVAPGQLRREDVLAVLSEGAPTFLSKVEVEPVLDRGGHFHGWRVVALHDEALNGTLQPGDVVLRVNGKRIETPFEFFDVFQSMAFAPELRVAVDRNGARQELRYPISDDPSTPPPPRAEIGESKAR